MLTRDHIKWLSPRAKEDQIQVLSSDWAWKTLAHYGINKTPERLAGFLANVFVETGGFTIFQESLCYTSADRLRKVWPSRFGKKSDAELAPLLNDERALADAVYAGRMGNRPGTDDAFVFRGVGFLQCTGRDAAIKYYKLANIDLEADASQINNLHASFLVACAEWAEYHCSELMDEGRFGDACVKINAGPGALNRVRAGKITHRQACQSLPERLSALEKCRKLLGANPAVMESFPGTDADDDAEYEEEDEAVA